MRKALSVALVLMPFACSSPHTSSVDGSTGGSGAGAAAGTAGAGGNAGAGAGSSVGGNGGAASGSAGTGVAGGGGGAGGASACVDSVGPADTSNSVLERNKHPNRDGAFVQPTLTQAAAASMAADTGFVPNLNASATTGGNDVWASPLYLENGPNGKGAFFAVTTGNDVYALDETTGAKIWSFNIGSSPTMNGGTPTCGSIHPLGIISTPVIDATTTPPTIYVAGAIGTTSIMSHQVHALSIGDTAGTEKAGWPIDVSNVTSGSITFDTVHENQRSALSLVGGTLYVAYGGHVGDCGGYHGWVVGIDTQTPTSRGAWATGGQGEGIWAAGGMASNGTGVFVATGNNTQRVTTHLDSEEVVHITGLGTLDTANTPFFPTSWNSMDSGDADLGSNHPLYVESSCSTPSKMVIQVSKDGHLYILDAAQLGAANGGGQKVDFMVSSGVMSIHSAPAFYRTAKGLYVVFSTNSGAMCPSSAASGLAGGEAVISVLIQPGAPPVPKLAWCAPLSGQVTGAIATTTDGASEPIVWYINNGVLTGVDGDSGAQLVPNSAHPTPASCSGVRQWSQPIAVKGRIVTTGDGHLCSWSSH